MAIGLGECLPEMRQRDAPGWLRWARGGTGRAGWLRMIVLRAEAVPGEVGSNLPASKAPEPQLWGSAQRIDKAKLPVQSVCVFCNLRKGPNLAGIDRASGKLVPPFNPRRDRWRDHFEWQGPILAGLSMIGRATIHVLNMNDPAAMEVRQVLIDEGVFPPQ
jgi:hypothetical protein